ncbi:hypothetical protein Hs30E_16770 [Lactococcus hodotermopsidis]|uniref:DNA methylase adenine-specific domain-containing protein n=2 Tax=Pseudolactococcus hodotermopsidis TaxID=2709157 RepID=A0A6A0BEA3_9LACT|nr:hypothetical protein Hs30E_16770 [Lactococcus hodotermopsidis]
MLDTIGYVSGKILKKHIIDNSCGNGTFLQEIVKSYIEEARSKKISEIEIRADLGKYVHGIEIDELEYGKCRCFK